MKLRYWARYFHQRRITRPFIDFSPNHQISSCLSLLKLHKPSLQFCLWTHKFTMSISTNMSKLVQLQRPQSHPSNSSSSVVESPQGRTNPLDSAASNNSKQTFLRNEWVLWYLHRSPGQKIHNYEKATRKIATFSTVEEFWAVYVHLQRPSSLPNISDIHIFKAGIQPMWEDPINIDGGKWIIRLRKGIANRYWEEISMALVGDQFGEEVCGAVLSVRNLEDVISIWVRSTNRGNIKVKGVLKMVLGCPSDTIIDFKSHKEAMNQQKNNHHHYQQVRREESV